MHVQKLSEFNFCENVLRLFGIPQQFAHNIYVIDIFHTLIMLNSNFYTKDLSQIKNIILDIRDKDFPVIVANNLPFIRESMYKPYDPTDTEINTKYFSNVNFNSHSEFLNCNYDNLIRVFYYDNQDKWIFSSSKKIDDEKLDDEKLDLFSFNKNFVYMYNYNKTLELISVHTRCGDYLRKLSLHFFKNTSLIEINSSADLIKKIDDGCNILYFNPKNKGYIKFIKNFNTNDKQLLYLISRVDKKNFIPNPKIECDIEWLPLYILKCYQRKQHNKNLKFNTEEYFLIKKIQNSKNQLVTIIEELKLSTPIQLNNLINNMYLYAESCVS